MEQTFFHLNSPEACLIEPVERWEQEFSHELTLPDYIPDNARPVHSGADLRLSEWGLQSGELFARGELNFLVVTLDGEGVLRTVKLSLPVEMHREFSADGEFSVRMPGEVDEILCRPLSPRKYALRCRVNLFPLVWQSRSVLPEISGGSLGELERDEASVNGMVMRALSGEGIQISEDIELEGTLPAVSEILSAEVAPLLNEWRPGSGGLDFAGEAQLKVLYRGEDNAFHALNRRIPLSGNLAGPADGGEALGWATAYDLRVNPEVNSYGERRILEVDFTYDVTALCGTNGEIPVVNDLYCVGAETVVERDNLPLRVLKRALNTNFSVNAAKNREECAAEGVKAVVCAEVALGVPVWTADESKNRLVMELSAAISLICTDEEGGIVPVNYSLPVRFELDGAGDLPALTLLHPANIRTRLDTGTITCDFEVMAGILQWESADVTVVRAASVDRSAKKPARLPIVLCYPRPGQRLWEIAKRYDTTVSAIAAVNHLSGDAVASEKVLLIPFFLERKNQRTLLLSANELNIIP